MRARLSPALALLTLGGGLACTDAPTTVATVGPPDLDATPVVIVADTAGGRAVALRRSVTSGRTVVAVAPFTVTISAPTVLKLLGSCCGNHAVGINNAGQVVGADNGPDASTFLRAVLWEPSGEPRDLGHLGRSGGSVALRINTSGQVVGESSTADGATHAFLWTPTAGMRDLGTLGGGDASSAKGLNDAGAVVGSSNASGGGSPGVVRPFLWTPDAGMQDLGLFFGQGGTATDVNDHGVVVGASATGFRWTPSTGMQDLNPIGGSFGNTHAAAINNAGQIAVGTLSRAGFVWQAGTARQIAPLPPTVTGVDPTDINERGQVVGVAFDASGQLVHPFFWQPGLGVVLLPALAAGESAEANALNDRGQVVGQSGTRAVLWTVRVHTAARPVVDRLHAVVLPPGIVTGPGGVDLSGVWLRVRLTDPGDDGPWDWRIDWGDDVVSTPSRVAQAGEFVFLRRTPYTSVGPHTITVTATDPTGATSTPATTALP